MDQPLTDQQLTARYERLADTAGHALHALGYLIEDHSDPGADALGAQYNLRQELLGHTMREEPAEAVDAVAQHERRKAVAAAFARLDAHDWGYDHGFCDEYGTDPETDAFVDAALAVVQPELDRLRSELATGRDDDAVNLLDLLADGPTRPGGPDPIECDHEAELARLRAELEQTRQQALAEAAEIATTVIGPLWHLDTLHEIYDRINAAAQPTSAVRACGCPSRFDRHADGCPTLPAEATR